MTGKGDPQEAVESAPKRRTTVLSEEHKRALAVGRDEGRAVRRYLEALEGHRPRRGRRRTTDSIELRLAQIAAHLDRADPVSRVHMIQERINLEAEQHETAGDDGFAALEEDFVRTARQYGERRGLSYAAWRSAGVSAAVLRRAGVTRRAPNP
jgi:hypothetical protein